MYESTMKAKGDLTLDLIKKRKIKTIYVDASGTGNPLYEYIKEQLETGNSKTKVRALHALPKTDCRVFMEIN